MKLIKQLFGILSFRQNSSSKETRWKQFNEIWNRALIGYA